MNLIVQVTPGDGQAGFTSPRLNISKGRSFDGLLE
jgi:hypothetical protein